MKIGRFRVVFLLAVVPYLTFSLFILLYPTILGALLGYLLVGLLVRPRIKGSGPRSHLFFRALVFQLQVIVHDYLYIYISSGDHIPSALLLLVYPQPYIYRSRGLEEFHLDIQTLNPIYIVADL